MKRYINTLFSKYFILIGIVILLFSVFISVSTGSTNIDILSLLSSFTDKTSSTFRIFYYIRIPRTLAALFSGVALAVSGYVLQIVLKNDLAASNIIGVNSGAGLGIVIVSVFLPSSLGIYSNIASFIGALGAVSLVYFISSKSKSNKLTLVLSGIAVNTILSAIIDAIITINPDSLTISQAFKLGGTSGVTYKVLIPSLILIVITLFLTFLFSLKLEVLTLGDELSTSLGEHPRITRKVFLLFAAILSSASVSLVGLVGYIGLIIPHIVKICIRGSIKKELFATMIYGGVFFVFCDLMARTLFRPYEIPVGILLSFFGGPFFIYLILRRTKI